MGPEGQAARGQFLVELMQPWLQGGPLDAQAQFTETEIHQLFVGQVRPVRADGRNPWGGGGRRIGEWRGHLPYQGMRL